VRLAALRDAPYAFGSTYEAEVTLAEADWRARLEARTQFVAELRGLAIGTAGAYVRDAIAAELVSMWVSPSARGRGAGDALVRAVVGWARDQGFTAVGLWVATGNDRAESLYLRHGFARTGEVKRILAGSDRMEFAMTLRLTAASS